MFTPDYSIQKHLDVGKKDENVKRIDYSNPPLKKLNLRANHLKGNIILGNFTVRKPRRKQCSMKLICSC